MNLIYRILNLISRIGADSRDSDELRLQKALMATGSFMISLAGILWGVMYFALGQPLAGIIPLSYTVLSLLSIGLFALTRRFQLFRFVQLVLILLLPFFLMTSLGGFVNSSAVILWSLLCPFGALLFDEPRSAPRWLVAYLDWLFSAG